MRSLTCSVRRNRPRTEPIGNKTIPRCPTRDVACTGTASATAIMTSWTAGRRETSGDNTMTTIFLSFLGILAFIVLLFIIERIYYALFPEKDER